MIWIKNHKTLRDSRILSKFSKEIHLYPTILPQVKWIAIYSPLIILTRWDQVNFQVIIQLKIKAYMVNLIRWALIANKTQWPSSKCTTAQLPSSQWATLFLVIWPQLSIIKPTSTRKSIATILTSSQWIKM